MERESYQRELGTQLHKIENAYLIKAPAAENANIQRGQLSQSLCFL